MTRWLLLGLLVASGGCHRWRYVDYRDPPPDTEPVITPRILDIDIPDWPPPNASTLLTVTLRKAWVVRFEFAKAYETPVTEEQVSVTGGKLGEGFGTLTIVATGSGGATATRWVDDLLIDMSPPEIVLGPTTISGLADSDFELWVSDAWVLGGVTLEIGDTVLEHSFKPGYPSTVGKQPDSSLVTFPASALPVGGGKATLTATDAAGNAASKTFQLVVDADLPEVVILAPSPGLEVSGSFGVTLKAADPGGGPVTIYLRVDGAAVATLLGPNASVQLDASELVAGPHTLEARARDQAGNIGLPFEVPFVVVPE